ncbi:MAG TPA: ATP-binding protein [Candidatus Acidoferrales bacterium]|nr:ATP-binding protein [Candidatus Acidoferrales bacterium]
MTFRGKLFWMFTIALVLSVVLIAAGVTVVARKAFDENNAQHTEALVAQFQREFSNRGQEVAHRVQTIANAESTVRMAIDLARPTADPSIYVDDATGVSQSSHLDILDFVSNDGTIISSAEYHARFGYKLQWIKALTAGKTVDWVAQGPFLMKIDTQAGPAVALLAVSTVRVGDRNLYIVGGERLGREFLGSLVLPQGMRALLYLNLENKFEPADLMDENGAIEQADRFASSIEKDLRQPAERKFTVNQTADAKEAEVFHETPLLGRQSELLGILMVGSSQREVVILQRRIEVLAAITVVIGIVIALLFSWWGSARVTKPIQELAEGARAVSNGNWNTRVEVRGGGDVAQLATAFNQMTQQLADQRERLLQTERVAAWREVARRLAHELKNPLFPLQTTVENLRRSKDKNPDQFEEVFRESTGILLSEIENLKTIVGRFSDFAKMPQPELGAVNVNEVVRSVVKLFEAQFGAVGRPPITPELHLDEELPTIQADQTLLHRAVENLVLNAMDAMPAGGVLMLRTSHQDGKVDLEVSDTGTGLTPEECDRLFTPYYTTKQHGTGLGLAIVQSVVSDHGGRVSVESESGVGTSVHIELPSRPPKKPQTPEAVAVKSGE